MCIPRCRSLEPKFTFIVKGRRFFFGFSLVEVTLALGILTFTLTALFGVFAVGARADRQSIMEMEATHVIQSMIAGRRARPVVDNDPANPDGDPSLILPPLDKDNANRDTSNPVYVDRAGKVVDVLKAEFKLVYRIAPTKKVNGAGGYSDVYCALYWPAQGKQPAAGVLPVTEGQTEFVTRIPLP